MWWLLAYTAVGGLYWVYLTALWSDRANQVTGDGRRIAVPVGMSEPQADTAAQVAFVIFAWCWPLFLPGSVAKARRRARGKRGR